MNAEESKYNIMKFLATRKFIENRERFDNQEIESLKEHVEIVYQHIKEYLDNSDEDFTILEENAENAEDVYGLFWFDDTSVQPLIHSKIYTNPVSKVDSAIIDHDEYVQDIFHDVLEDLFWQYSIEVRYSSGINFELFKQMIEGKEI